MRQIVDGEDVADYVTLYGKPSVKHRMAPGKRSMISWKSSWKMSGAGEFLGSLIKSRMT